MDMQTTALAPYRSASSRIDRSIKAHCNYTFKTQLKFIYKNQLGGCT